ncbi:hypothetical protein P3T23_002123 [Paraburkholderia sp. GAS448]|uniref:hypothetical protein n=1 Tax=Paraburkholderia sp. GAS448 TaxID=3035136 RepID=UPI003D262096
MDTGRIPKARGRISKNRMVLSLLAVIVLAVGAWAASDPNEAIDDAGLVMNYFRSLTAPAGTTTTETNPNN